MTRQRFRRIKNASKTRIYKYGSTCEPARLADENKLLRHENSYKRIPRQMFKHCPCSHTHTVNYLLEQGQPCLGPLPRVWHFCTFRELAFTKLYSILYFTDTRLWVETNSNLLVINTDFPNYECNIKSILQHHSTWARLKYLKHNAPLDSQGCDVSEPHTKLLCKRRKNQTITINFHCFVW